MSRLAFLVLLVGCPEPADELPASAPPVGTPGAPGEVPPPPAGGDAKPAGPSPGEMSAGAPGAAMPSTAGGPPSTDGGAIPSAGGSPPSGGAPPAGGMPPSIDEITARTLASLANGGATVKIRGRLEGAQKAQVDFTAVKEQDGNKAPEILQIVAVTGGTFEVEAPATYDRPIYVSASLDEDGDGIDPEDPGGIAAAPLTLAGADLEVVITMSKDGSWAKNVPWYSADSPAPPPPPGAPSGAGAPSGPPNVGSVSAPSAAAGAPAGESVSPSGWVFVTPPK